jgi:hypothetical protein
MPPIRIRKSSRVFRWWAVEFAHERHPGGHGSGGFDGSAAAFGVVGALNQISTPTTRIRRMIYGSLNQEIRILIGIDLEMKNVIKTINSCDERNRSSQPRRRTGRAGRPRAALPCVSLLEVVRTGPEVIGAGEATRRFGRRVPV